MMDSEKQAVVLDNNCCESVSDDEDDEHRDDNQKPLIDSNGSLTNNSLPISIGKIKIFKPRRRNRLYIRKYLTICILLLILILLIIYLIKFNRSSLSSLTRESTKMVTTCDRLSSVPVWNITFPMLTIESALRLVDANNDSIFDVIVPFGTGIDAAEYPLELCQIYFNQTENEDYGCGGGVLALDGRTGQQLWRRYTPHELFASNCGLDINEDGINDCILGGRMASLYAIDGASGDVIWFVTPPEENSPISKTSNFYTPLFIPRDIDSDGVPDIVVIHGGDPLRKPKQRVRIPGRLIVMSAKTGQIFTASEVPDRAESYYSPQKLTHPDGTLYILFGSGGETHAGSLFVIPFDDLLRDNMKNARIIYKDCCKGVMVPPVLIDMNGDGTLDIVMSLFNSTVIAFNGLTFKVMWTTQFAGSETYSSPAVGRFTNDTIPDFAVLYQFGPGFPVYYHTQLSILDGRNGNRLLKNNVDMLIGTQSSPLTISTLAANDIFLFWYSSCETNANNSSSINDLKAQKFKLAPGTTVHDNSRADFCKLRFNSTLYTQLRAISPTFTTVLYDSREHQNEDSGINYTKIAYKWIEDHMRVRSNDYYDNNEFSNAFLNQNNPSKYQQNENIYYQSLLGLSPQSNNYKNRFKRHVGVHDGGGVQRVISTGTLAPPISNSLDTIDLIFTTYWFPAAKNVRLMSTEMENCISNYMAPETESRLRLEDETSKYKQLDYDHDAYEETVREICAKFTNQKNLKATDHRNLIREMGSMTVYRINLRCVSNMNSNHLKSSIKEYNDQWWPSYLGKHADCVANV